MASLEKKYPKLAAEILFFQKEKHELVLFDQSQGTGFKVDGLGSHFCVKCNGRETLADLIDSFRTEEGKSVLALEKEVHRLVQRLTNSGLLEFLDEPLPSLEE